MGTGRKTRVLVVDDSAVVRQMMTRILETDPEIEVIGAACDPFAAVRRIQDDCPDVITLDVEMPRMDGITFLERMMSQHPIPTVICSTLTAAGSDMALLALERGAVDIITKPKIGTQEFFEESRDRICAIVKAAAGARIRKIRTGRQLRQSNMAEHPTENEPVLRPAAIQTTEKVVVVGASTGGTEALREFLEAMPANCPGIAIVQHMPEAFTARFAERLNSICRVTVKEAEEGDSIIRGQALIAPGNRHMLVCRSGARHFVELNDGPLVSRHKPSVDVLFRSAAKHCGRNAVGVIMTGMGGDGAHGMLEMKQAGATNLAQDEESCVVFGMPQEAIKLGGVDRILPLNKMAAEVVRLAR
jgi:two-component system, chemotaxis family, protein-glutamate methylesterase/glutaminase